MKKVIYRFLLLSILLSNTSCFFRKTYDITDFEISSDKIRGDLATGKDVIYDSLLKRFLSFDTTLVERDYKLLYYGQVFRKGYSAQQGSNLSSIEADIRGKRWENASQALDTVLSATPLDLSANYYRAYVEMEMGKDSVMAQKYRGRMNQLSDAILSTGDGMDAKNAIDVVFVLNEYFICYNLLYTGEIVGYQKVTKKGRNYDVLIVKPSENYKKKKVWFDVTMFRLSNWLNLR